MIRLISQYSKLLIYIEKELKVSDQLFEQAAILRDKEKKLLEKLSTAQQIWQKSEGNISVELNEDHIADVVSLMTGIPVSKVAESESKKLLLLANELSTHIVGQDEAITQGNTPCENRIKKPQKANWSFPIFRSYWSGEN